MKTDFKVNVSRSEAIRRYVLGGGLIAAVVLSSGAIPAWIALAACYPIFTAMVQWDPLNAISQKVVNNASRDVKEAMFRKSVA
ncbi:MAG: hypothetical protein PVH98_00235 [Gammaproteobacteria bacterium]|jgi:hypothetical protein